MSTRLNHGSYQPLVDAARTFVERVEAGKVRSIKTYGELKKALINIDEIEAERVITELVTALTNTPYAEDRYRRQLEDADVVLTRMRRENYKF